MGEIADDYFDSMMREHEVRKTMEAADCIPCPNCRANMWLADVECPVCHDLGWLDKDNNPCEP
jgi:hypothetical protein